MTEAGHFANEILRSRSLWYNYKVKRGNIIVGNEKKNIIQTENGKWGVSDKAEKQYWVVMTDGLQSMI